MSTTSSGWKVIAAMVVVAAGAVAIGVGPRMAEHDARARVAEQAAAPARVRVAEVRKGDAQVEVTLPGTSAPIREAVLYSKATGFVRKNLVDLGDRVTEGQVLAEIDAPETTEEIRLARARLAEARANVGIAATTSKRMTSLAQSGAASQQEADDARAQSNSADALVATRRAEVQRLEVLRDYQHIVAPFAGIVTRRLVDPGALVGPASAGGTPMFEIADAGTLKVIVDVPDSHAADVRAGIEVDVYSPRDPARTVTGTVTRTAGVLEQSSRTLRIEVHVPADGVLLPGAFVYAKLRVPRARPVPVIPASALIVRKEGTLVAKVEGDTVTLAKVVLGRDFGKEIEVVEGVVPGERVVVQPLDTLESGQPVEVIPAAT